MGKVIGIDLGTSRTSVAASNGVRETVWSYVGYPKDVVSRKLLKKDKVLHFDGMFLMHPMDNDKVVTLKMDKDATDAYLKAQ